MKAQILLHSNVCVLCTYHDLRLSIWENVYHPFNTTRKPNYKLLISIHHSHYTVTVVNTVTKGSGTTGGLRGLNPLSSERELSTSQKCTKYSNGTSLIEQLFYKFWVPYCNTVPLPLTLSCFTLSVCSLQFYIVVPMHY